MKQYFGILLVLFWLASPAIAADIDGKWIGSVDGLNGNKVELTYAFKAEGGKLTGTLKSSFGEREIVDGKIEGNVISFSIVTETFSVANKGILQHDEIKLEEKIGNDTLPIILKRVK